MSERKPVDGVAVLLHLVEAARAVTKDYQSEIDPRDFRRLGKMCDELERWIEQETPTPEPVGWEPRRWRELVEGDRVSMGGVEATVIRSLVLGWHADPKSNPYAPVPMERTVARIELDFRPGQPYDMPADGEVETLRGELGQEIDRMNGYRSVLAEEPVNVLEGWAADAASTLRAAGLAPETLRQL